MTEKKSTSAKHKRESFEIAGISVAPGSQAMVDLPLSLLYDHTPMTLTMKIMALSR